MDTKELTKRRKVPPSEFRVRIDHSKVHLENDQFADDLDETLRSIALSQQKQCFTREHEIKALKHLIGEPRPASVNLRRCTTSMSAATTDSYLTHLRIPSVTVFSSCPKGIEQPLPNPNYDSESTVSDTDSDGSDMTFASSSDISSLKFLKTRNTNDATSLLGRGPRPCSRAVSGGYSSLGFRSKYTTPTAPSRLSSRLKFSGANIKRPREFPAAWYTSVLPAMDVHVRKRPMSSMSRCQSTTLQRSTSTPNIFTDHRPSRVQIKEPTFRTEVEEPTSDKRPPRVGLSLRRLKEMTKVERKPEVNVKENRRTTLLAANKLRFEQIQERIKDFIQKIEEMKQRRIASAKRKDNILEKILMDSRPFSVR